MLIFSTLNATLEMRGLKMKSLSQALNLAKPISVNRTRLNGISKEAMAKAWLGLQACRQIPMSEEVGSSTFLYWKTSLEADGFTDADILNGVQKVSSFVGILTLGKFKELCGETKAHACHQPWIGLPAPKMSKEERKIRMAQLRAEVGL